jgi:alkylhydroperoxidase family enzyme
LARADKFLSGAPDAPAMPPILGLLARHPRLGAPWLAFSAELLDDAALDPRHRELLVLRVGWRTDCTYLWEQHVGMADATGLTPEQISAVRGAADAWNWTDVERDLLHAADELIDDHVVSDSTWARLADTFESQELLEVLFVVGSYVCLAMVLNSAGLRSG